MNFFRSLFVLCSLSVCVSAYSEETANLYIHGQVTEVSCEVADKSEDIDVFLGDLSIGSFRTTGDVSPQKKFSIELKNCSNSIKNAVITFQGDADTVNPDLLRLSRDSSAAGVGIEIISNTGESLALNKPFGGMGIKPGNNSLEYFLRYKSTKNSVTPGTANSVMYFDISYQ